MRRSWNRSIWIGFLLALAAVFSYIPLFVRYPVTRDIPWVNLLLFAAAIAMLAVGLKRAYGRPERYRGKVSGAILMLLTVAALGVFCWGAFVFARRVPVSSGAPHVGQQAPGFTLADAHGTPVELSNLLHAHRAVVLIFYRGYW
jgi:ABC-type transport system involved in cytochrome c biogenesis permease subunit